MIELTNAADIPNINMFALKHLNTLSIDFKKKLDSSACFFINKTEYLHEPCHNKFIRYHREKHFTANVLRRVYSQDSLDYVEWLLSKDSPYEKATSSDNFWKFYKEKRLVAFGWVDFDKEPFKHLCHNLLIASRLGTSQGLGPFWKFLVDCGMNPTVALRLLTYVYPNGVRLQLNAPGMQGDQPFNNYTYPSYNILQTSLKWLLEKKFDEKLVSDYRCNSIWAGPVGKSESEFTSIVFPIDILNTLIEAYNYGKMLTTKEIKEIEKKLIEVWL